MTLGRRLVLASGVVFALGLLLSLVVRIGAIADADHEVTAWLHDRAIESERVVDVTLAVTTIGNPLTLTAFVVITAGWLLVHRHVRTAVWLVTVTLMGAVVESILKVVVGRARPDFDSVLLDPVSKSFPSGHAMNTTVVLGAITVAVVAAATSPRAGAVPAAAVGAVIVAFGVGVSRPALGVHFVSDVIAGWLLGVVWLVVARPGPTIERAASAGETTGT